jgi:hypothetical protein
MNNNASLSAKYPDFMTDFLLQLTGFVTAREPLAANREITGGSWPPIRRKSPCSVHAPVSLVGVDAS